MSDENQCTSEQASESDSAAASMGGEHEAGGSVSCSQSNNTIACDIKEMSVSEIAGSRSTPYHVVAGVFTAEEPEVKRGIRLFDVATQWPKQPKLQVIGDRPGASSPTKIRLTLEAFASCGDTHVAATVTPPPGETDHDYVVPGGSQVFTFPVSRYQSPNTAVAFFERYITWGISPATYLVSAASCGVRPGQQANGGGSLTVEVFPADQYQLTLHVPPRGKIGYSREKTDEYGASSTTSEDSTAWTFADRDSSTTSKQSTKITWESSELEEEATTKTDPAKLTFDFSHNGQSGDDVTANINKLLKILSDAQEAIKAIKDLIHDWVPQVGFKFEFDLSFLAGDIVMAWGYKENDDWQVYYGWSAKFTLAFFKIDLTLSFGIQCNLLTARVLGTCGGETNLVTEFDFNAPGPIVLDASCQVKVDIPASISGEGKLGPSWASVGVDVGVKTGFNGAVGLKNKGNTGTLFANIKWEGIDGFVKTKKKPTQGETEDLYHLIDEKDIWKGELKF